MLFNSFQFFIFLPLVFVGYWYIFKNSLRGQNIFILVASYVFYAWWDYRFLSLIVISTLIDFFAGIALEKASNQSKRKLFLGISITANLGFLGFFKYYNFFIESWVEAWSLFDVEMQTSTLQIILPVGISFYTFQTLSYTIDVYRRQMKPTHNFVDFAAFVAFFPQLVAGPIERASNLLPQFFKKREFKFKTAVSGLHLIVWGLFKKIVIADSCAIFVNEIFSNYEQMNALSLILGSIYFAFQIYGDFSGYSDIAIGTARLFGFNLMQNFKYPYFSRDIAEFWRRWHISLTTWFRDYVYIPLGGSRVNKLKQIRNVFIVFLISGFWHGANWTFVFWGLLNSLFFIPLLLFNKNRIHTNALVITNLNQGIRQFLAIVFTFALTCFAWVFFRADSILIAFNYLNRILNFDFYIQYLRIDRYSVELLILIGVFVIIEWFNKCKEEPISGKYSLFKLILVVLGIITLGSYSNPQDFIYFQF
jgi:alginate O-acetyltransferase complex protein AlgI